MDDGDAVAEFFRYFQHMGGKQHGVSGIGVFTHHLFELVRGARVKAGQRLIENPDRRLVDQCAHHHDFLTHAMRVAHDTARKVLFHLKAFCGFFDKTLTFFRSDTVDICHKIQVFNSPDAKKRIRVVGHKTELALGFERILLDIFSIDFNRSLGRCQDAGDHF